MSSENIDLMKCDISNINLNYRYIIENIKLTELEDKNPLKRDCVINCLLNETKDKKNIVYETTPFKKIPKDIAEKLINDPSTLRLDINDIHSLNLKLTIKK
jgi:hypothetical protein